MEKNYKGVIFDGSTFPDSPYRIVPVTLNATIKEEYIPALNTALPNATKGLRCLLIAMTHQEGFQKRSRSYRTKNPGNIGNTDSGANKQIATLSDGVKLQADFITAITNGQKKAFPLDKPVFLKPDFSEELHKNQKTYGLGNGDIPGYKFVYTGQLDQFVKIYATGPRLTNSYINTIVSYFKMNGLSITPESKLADIIKMN